MFTRVRVFLEIYLQYFQRAWMEKSNICNENFAENLNKSYMRSNAKRCSKMCVQLSQIFHHRCDCDQFEWCIFGLLVTSIISTALSTSIEGCDNIQDQLHFIADTCNAKTESSRFTFTNIGVPDDEGSILSCRANCGIHHMEQPLQTQFDATYLVHSPNTTHVFVTVQQPKTHTHVLPPRLDQVQHIRSRRPTLHKICI
jgi:hypothetical protein